MTPIAFVDLKAQYRALKPLIDANIQAVLDHGGFIMGPEVAELERRLAEFTGARHAIAVSSGTDALLMPLLAAGVGPGDAVFVPSFTFTATAEVVLLLGAAPVFVDVEESRYAIDPGHLETQIAAVRRDGRLRPRAVIAVDLFGLPADYPALAGIAEREELLLIADSAQSLGGAAANHRVGCLAPVTATSFFPAKPLGGYGDGGAVFTDDDALAETLRSIRLHGKGRGKYDIVRVGINGRLDTLQAAVLLAKLTVFSDEIARREALARYYDRRLAGLAVTPPRPAGLASAWAQYTLQLDDRNAVREVLAAQGIPTQVYYPLPMHLQPAYAAYGAGTGSLPVSERLSRRVLSLPMHAYLPDADAARIADALVAALAPRHGNAAAG